MTASSTVSAVNQPVTLTATLSRLDPATNQWVALESGKPVQIWHTFDGVRYNDTIFSFLCDLASRQFLKQTAIYIRHLRLLSCVNSLFVLPASSPTEQPVASSVCEIKWNLDVI
ncbi:MAG: hypothetical protein WBZ42_03095 [Halobacteriota archaeon]